jgi:chromosome segregation ATPase
VVIRTRIRSAEEEELDNSIEDLRAEIEELEEQRRRLIEETAETSEALLTARLDATSFREEIEREAVLSTEELERALQMAFDEFIMGINGQVDRFRSGMTDVQESLDDHVHNEETSEEPPEAIETAKSSYDHILEEDYPTEDDPSEREPQA